MLGTFPFHHMQIDRDHDFFFLAPAGCISYLIPNYNIPCIVNKIQGYCLYGLVTGRILPPCIFFVPFANRQIKINELIGMMDKYAL